MGVTDPLLGQPVEVGRVNQFLAVAAQVVAQVLAE